MLINGVDTNSVADQFSGIKTGITLIHDGDGDCYVAAATAKRLDTALRNFQQAILKRMFMVKAQDAKIHLTARDSDKHGRFRVIAAKPYQGNRTGKSKPPMLEPLREAVADNSTWLAEYDVILHRELEADDGMIQDAYTLKEAGVISSADKDLRMTPYPYYEEARGQVMASQPVGWVSIKHTDAGNPKMTGQGPMFFFGQLLAGDTADNIRGIAKLDGKLCGAAGAYNALKDCSTIEDAANVVLDAYRSINQNVIAEGWLLWLTRWQNDNVIKYLNELNISNQNKDFIQDCAMRAWATPKETRDAHDTNN